ncbi:MAG: YkvA family protein [Cyclobacteriaceae bacterium]
MGKFDFNSAKSKARNIANDPKKLSQLLGTTIDKLKDVEGRQELYNDFIGKVNTFIRMMQAVLRGDYQLPWKSIILIVAGLVYFVSPVDLIPDFIPMSGLIDDVSIILWVFSTLQEDIEQYREWETSSS